MFTDTEPVTQLQQTVVVAVAELRRRVEHLADRPAHDTVRSLVEHQEPEQRKSCQDPAELLRNRVHVALGLNKRRNERREYADEPYISDDHEQAHDSTPYRVVDDHLGFFRREARSGISR